MGDGETVKDGDVATVEYTGRLLVSDKEFDKGSIGFKVGAGNVIPGWEKGLLGMKVGGKRTLKVPPNLAYGERGAGDVIPPNSDLVFDCELKSVATGPLAEFTAKFNIGFNRQTLFAIGFLLTIILPRLGIGEKGLI